MDRESLIRHFNTLKSGLLPLRHLLSADSSAERIFDEYLDHDEYELALHILCHSLLQHDGIAIENREIDIIATLHQMMEINDECVAHLRQRSIRMNAL